MNYLYAFLTSSYRLSMLLSVLSLIVSCHSKNDPSKSFQHGTVVVNEGNFGNANGSLSFIHTNGSVTQNAFATVNGGQPLGDVPFSAHVTDNRLFVVVNNSNAVYALNKSDLTLVYQLTQVTQPRYMTHQGSIGYLTEWIDYTRPGQLKSFDLSTGNLLDSVTVGKGPEFPLILDNHLYVSNSMDSTLSIVSLDDFSVLSTFRTPPAPGQMALVNGSDIWLICGGGYDANYAPANDGAIVKITNQAIAKKIPLHQNVFGKLAVAPDESTLYYFAGSQLWSLSTTDASLSLLPQDPDVNTYYGIGVATDGTIYAGDPKGFQSAGVVTSYTPSGEKITSYTVGIAPGAFVFY